MTHTSWTSDPIVDGDDMVRVMARGGQVVLAREGSDNAVDCRLTVEQARARALAHVAIAEALTNAANRLEQAQQAGVPA